jgi:hypothetical protein
VLVEAVSITDRLPGRFKQPDLGNFLWDLNLQDRAMVKVLQKIDEVFVSFGL